MTALWTADEAAAATAGRNTRPWNATGVSIDSRTVAKGDLFIALAGPKFDGHDFVAGALAKGAAAALVARVPPDAPADAPLLVVDDTLAALESLGRAARQRATAQVPGCAFQNSCIAASGLASAKTVAFVHARVNRFSCSRFSFSNLSDTKRPALPPPASLE